MNGETDIMLRSGSMTMSCDEGFSFKAFQFCIIAHLYDFVVNWEWIFHIYGPSLLADSIVSGAIGNNLAYLG